MTSSTFPRFVNPSYFGGSACIFLNVSLVLFIIAFASPYWFESEDSYYLGLWKACYRKPADVNVDPIISTTTAAATDNWQCSSSQYWVTSTAQGHENDWLVGVEAILMISLIFLVVTSVALILFVGSSPMRRELAQAIVFASFCLTFTIACFSLTGVIVCGVLVIQEDSAVYGANLSWSFSIAVTSTCLTWFCAFALLVEVVRVMAAAPVDPMSAQQSFHAQYRSMELRESFASGLNVDQNEALGHENEASAIEDEASAIEKEASTSQKEADVQDGGGHYEKPEASWAAGTVGQSLYESLGILPSQFSTSDI